MQARLGDSVSGRNRPVENSLLTKHVVAAGSSAKDAGSTPAASSLRSSAARTKTAAPESAFGTKAGFVKRRGSARTTCRAEVRRKRATRQASKPEMEFCYVCILQSQVEP